MAFGDEISDFSSLFTSYTMTQQSQVEDNSNHNSATHNRNASQMSSQGLSMDSTSDFVQPAVSSDTRPLQIRKASGQLRVARSHHQLNMNDRNHGISISAAYPPRRSSIRNINDVNASPSSRYREQGHQRQHSETPSAYRSTISSKGDLLSDTSFDASSPSMTTSNSTRSTGSSNHAHYLSDSSDIIGNFVPVGGNKMPSQHASSSSSGRKVSMAEHARPRSPSRIPRPTNPYEFEPDTPYAGQEQRQTQFSDFIEHPGREFSPPPRAEHRHKKNARSDEQTSYITRDDDHLLPPKRSYATLQRSESSPSLIQVRFDAPIERVTSPDISAYYTDEFTHSALPYRGRSPSPSRSDLKYEYFVKTPTYHDISQSFSTRSRSRSPVRRKSNDSAPPSVHGRHSGKTPVKALDDVAERDENRESDMFREIPTPRHPKKRSRSPMKKMFGENGWLGKSPDEIQDVKLQVKKAATMQKDKPTMMGKLRNKLGEFAEKADLSPGRAARSSNDKHPKISILSVSLGPPEQARLLMEVELMVVHTANTFLMNQFSQGRMAVDSIKKTVDAWKAKGRHVVIEFQYDQVTQRDLVAANQHNFRFYGERAGNDVRINSMLYNWKQVASMMAIRTFCDADTVILKLLFDIEQILELLGGTEAIMLRLQQIRATANEMMRLARQRKRAQTNLQGPPDAAGSATPGRAATWLGQSTNIGSSRGPSVDTVPYGGMKLVPESYNEGD
ncbi:hypothetical protein ONS95_002467 [Cadophora gregata]|uniref:uncharacterized protein n=1 Tax=Cadophora gregata TaxID=51156 RepID=UPI0026DBB3BA|nr:uncharacterized protein ONS95_002467 [Cadophora gregata]KAK0109793.1 hypothetical protein ONS95_002467 [Cadophora gregata]KAK0110580.1 hypothetical protein ONS96_002183 [Cadophora gregata f. sp. sojae]